MVRRLPEVKQLQDVLPGEAGRNHSQDVLLTNFDPRQALGDDQEVVQGQVFQAVAAGDFPLTVVHPWRDTVVSRSIQMQHLMPGKRRRRRTSYDAVELVLVLVPLPPQPQQLQHLLLGRAGLLQTLKALAIHLASRKTLQQPLQGHRRQPQRGERLVDGLLAQRHIWAEKQSENLSWFTLDTI